jgi:hypothetical protein
MCFGDSPDPAPPPPPPPAPPPTLEQSAPGNTAPKTADDMANRAAGTKKYRTDGLGIPTDSSSGGSSGLSIPV